MPDDDEGRIFIETDAWGTWVYSPDGMQRVGVSHLWQRHGEQTLMVQQAQLTEEMLRSGSWLDERFVLTEEQRCALALALWPEGWNDGTVNTRLRELEVRVEVLTAAAVEAEDAIERVLAQERRMTNKADRAWLRRRLDNLRVVLGDLDPELAIEKEA